MGSMKTASKGKSKLYYEALNKAFDSLCSKSQEEFSAMLDAQESSDITKLLMGYADSNLAEDIALEASSVNQTFTLNISSGSPLTAQDYNAVANESSTILSDNFIIIVASVKEDDWKLAA